MLLDDTAVRHCDLPEEVPGLDAFLDAQPPVDEAEIDAMFVKAMQHREIDILTMHDQTVELIKSVANVA
jgi:hypothetical protein